MHLRWLPFKAWHTLSKARWNGTHILPSPQFTCHAHPSNISCLLDHIAKENTHNLILNPAEDYPGQIYSVSGFPTSEAGIRPIGKKPGQFLPNNNTSEQIHGCEKPSSRYPKKKRGAIFQPGSSEPAVSKTAPLAQAKKVRAGGGIQSVTAY